MSFVGPLDVTDVLDRLQGCSELRGIDVAGDFEAAWEAGAPRSAPWAFVLVGGESAPTHTGASGLLVQTVDCLFGVVLVVKNLRRADLGSQAAEDLFPIVRAVRERLVGWKRPGARSASDLKSGRVLRMKNGYIWWQDVYRCDYRIEVRA